MDINQARTFLEIAHTGSFIAAAERLHITQTAVSARIRALENLLGRRLFIRNKAGARLTPAGERLVRHAMTMTQVWERARQQVALPAGRRNGISIGGEASLWDPLLTDWLVWMHRECPEIALRAEIDSPASLLMRVQDGSLDLVILYNPPSYPNLVTELLLEEKLVLVTTSVDTTLVPESYVYVDWGAVFGTSHQSAFPELSSPPVSISFGPLALTYLLTVGGCGYFRFSAVEPFLTCGRLRRVKNAPDFSHSTYLVYAEHLDSGLLHRVRQGLKHVVAIGERPGLPKPPTPHSRRRQTKRL